MNVAQLVKDVYGVRTDPHPYGKCDYCAKPSKHMAFHTQSDARAGSRRKACDEHKDKATADVKRFYEGSADRGHRAYSHVARRLGLTPQRQQKFAKEMIPQGEYANAPKQQQSWSDDHGKEYDEFTRTFVEPRQSIWGLHGDGKGAEQFGQHVAARVNATPSGDGQSPAENSTGRN